MTAKIQFKLSRTTQPHFAVKGKKQVNGLEINLSLINSITAPHMQQHEAEMNYLPKDLQKLGHASSEICQMCILE